jgi:hypothetical protein
MKETKTKDMYHQTLRTLQQISNSEAKWEEQKGPEFK